MFVPQIIQICWWWEHFWFHWCNSYKLKSLQLDCRVLSLQDNFQLWSSLSSFLLCLCTQFLEQIKSVWSTMFNWVKCSPSFHMKKKKSLFSYNLSIDFQNYSRDLVPFSTMEKKISFSFYNISYKMKYLGFWWSYLYHSGGNSASYEFYFIFWYNKHIQILYICICLTQNNFSLHLYSIHDILSTEIFIR